MKKSKVLVGFVIAEIMCLVIQYVLGMFVNLFVQFPSTLPSGDAWGWVFSHSGVTTAHILLGTVIVLLSLIALGISVAHRRGNVITLSFVGLLMVLFAWLSGARFLANVGQNMGSFMMAIGFIGAIVFYGWQLYALYHQRTAVNHR